MNNWTTVRLIKDPGHGNEYRIEWDGECGPDDGFDCEFLDLDRWTGLWYFDDTGSYIIPGSEDKAIATLRCYGIDLAVFDTTPAQRIAADLGLTTADLERIVRDERARKLVHRLEDAVRELLTEWGSMKDIWAAEENARALLAEIDRPINT